MADEMLVTITAEEAQRIDSSREMFDLASPLTPDELLLMGVVPSRLVEKESGTALPVIDIEEDQFAQPEDVDAVSLEMNEQTYGGRYAHYVRGQALVTLASFAEGWGVFQEQVLKAYVRARRRENREYRGDDPNRAHALRLKELAAEDFVNFINSSIAEAMATPKPILER